jgi:hypothetical protein
MGTSTKNRRVSRLNTARIKKATYALGHAGLTTVGTSQSFDAAVIPENSIIVGCDINVTEAFTDGAAGTFTADVGVKSGDTDAVLDGADLTTAIARLDSPRGVSGLPCMLFLDGATMALKVDGSVNVSTATAGALVLSVYYVNVSDLS